MKYKYGKLGKYHFMRNSSGIRSFLPETRLATKSNLQAMLMLYKSVYLKPDEGTGGHGIMKITRNGSRYIVRRGTVSQTYASYDRLYGSLHRLVSGRKYVVQKGIDLLRHRRRPFDIRVMVQKNRANELVVTGMVGRLAKAGKIVTNYHSGGKPLPVGTLLHSRLRGEKKRRYMNKIAFVGRKASLALGQAYRGNRAFGVDIAIDSHMKPWVLEVNTRPDMTIFRALRNKAMYKRILKYSKFKK
ncbi:YheC/YheD family protein [Paenibacillus rigui]|nr:YheC/YheD family protein [Paenibacillus rigui]